MSSQHVIVALSTRLRQRYLLLWLWLCHMFCSPFQGCKPRDARAEQRPESAPFTRPSTTKPTSRPSPITVAFIGDIMLSPHLAPPTAAQRADARRLWRGADVVIGNLESPQGPCVVPSYARAPTLCATPTQLRTVAALGVTHVTLANNHSFDAGKQGLARTRRTLRRLGRHVSGPCPNLSPSQGRACGSNANIQCMPLQLGSHHIMLLAINAVGSVHPTIKTPDLPPPAQIQRCVATWRKTHLIWVSIHQGRGYAKWPSIGDEARVAAAIRGGAQLVVGHHPHVIRLVERWRSTPVAWSLGNAISHQQGRGTEQGLLLWVTLRGATTKPMVSWRTERFRIVGGWPRREARAATSGKEIRQAKGGR